MCLNHFSPSSSIWLHKKFQLRTVVVLKETSVVFCLSKSHDALGVLSHVPLCVECKIGLCIALIGAIGFELMYRKVCGL